MTAESKQVWSSCYTCRDYSQHRREALSPALAEKAKREKRDVVEVVDEFMLAAHQRHLTGEPLRPDGPTRVTDPMIGRITALMAAALVSPVEGKKNE